MASLNEKLAKLQRLAAKHIEVRSIPVIVWLRPDHNGVLKDRDGTEHGHIDQYRTRPTQGPMDNHKRRSTGVYHPISYVIEPPLPEHKEQAEGSSNE